MSVGVQEEVVRLDVAVDEAQLVDVLDGDGRLGDVELEEEEYGVVRFTRLCKVIELLRNKYSRFSRFHPKRFL